MTDMPFHLQGKVGIDITGLASIFSQEETWKHKQQEVNSFASIEPTSVLRMRRSPSPPTSASTLSSSFNGGGGNSIDNTTTTAAENVVNPNERNVDWATELQPIPSGLEIVSGVERCGLGLDDWENMLSEPSQEQSLLRWIAGEGDDSSFGLKQLLQTVHSPLDFDGNGAGGLGIVDQGPGLEHWSGIAGGVSNIGNNLAAFPGSGFATTDSNNNGNGKVGSNLVIPSSSSGLVNDKSVGLGNNFSIQNPFFGPPSNNVPVSVSLPSAMAYHNQNKHTEIPVEKPQILNLPLSLSQQQSNHPQPQNPNFLFPLSILPQENSFLQPRPKRHNSIGMDSISQMIPKLPLNHQNQQQLLCIPQGVQFLHQNIHQKQMVVKKEETGAQQHLQQQQQQQHVLLDQLYKAAELVGTGNFSLAQGILARLNQQLSPNGKPLHRAAFYFTEALQLLSLMNNNPVTALQPRSPTPFDAMFKMGAYKLFSEVSPLIQFVNFTCTQALLEALVDASQIHIVDFDIGFGVQWASFMQELPRNGCAPALKITAFASPSTHHPVELALMRENLMQFANEIGISFELDVVNLDSLEQNCYTLPFFHTKENEAVAVNFPIWSCSNQPSALPSLLCFLKQLSPKIVVCLDRGCDRSDLSFPQHILHALQSYIYLLESLDAVNVAADVVNKIERFLLQPKIESTVLGRLRAPDKMPNWKVMFASAGFVPITFSDFTETQAECVVKRTPVKGFHVEKRQALLILCWQHRELISASAWRC